jgi:hypothetical protein
MVINCCSDADVDTVVFSAVYVMMEISSCFVSNKGSETLDGECSPWYQRILILVEKDRG